MDISELRTILHEHRHAPDSCARALLRSAAESRREELVVVFSAALGLGRLDARVAQQLLGAFELLKGTVADDVDEVAGLDALRAEVAQLSARREEWRQREEGLVTLQDAVRRLEAEEAATRASLSSLEQQMREFGSQRERLAALSAEVGE